MNVRKIFEKETGFEIPNSQIAYSEWLDEYHKWLESQFVIMKGKLSIINASCVVKLLALEKMYISSDVMEKSLAIKQIKDIIEIANSK